ncbi:aminodeoxychorismate lyase [Bacillus sp. CGMCC 1.16607]|uniref:aminodeoxychorismate lyase n=1 Tax=Bacillus sp. CGMCC 1.16607 TaxID=3351842 RepID=UPI00363D0112
MFIYMNGKIVSKEEAFVSAFDHGFLYGVGLFETFRVYDGHPFLLEDHLQRLNQGLNELCIERNFSKEEVEKVLSLLLGENGYKDAYIRLNVSAGIGELGLSAEPYQEPNIIMYSKPLPKAGKDIQEKKAQLLAIRRNTPEGNYRLKSHHFLNNILAKREIGSALDIEGIFLTANGELAEGVVSNLFWIKKGKIYTPSLETGILNGITRQFVMKLGEQIGFEVDEGFYRPEELNDADEIFITNSIQELVGICQWNHRNFPGKEGEVTRLLHNHYRHYCFNMYSRNDIG